MYTYTTSTPTITIQDMSYSWPDGDQLFSHLTDSLSGHIGLRADNGAGKSTLLQLIGGELQPDSGVITTQGTVGYLPQLGTLMSHSGSIAELLGIAELETSWDALNNGTATPAHYELLENHWDYPDQKAELLTRLHLDADRLSEPSSTFSGGERILVALTGISYARPDITLLDEPTNYLDEHMRQHAYELIENWPGTLVVATHDRELLNRLPQQATLHKGQITHFHGSFDQLRAQQDALQDVANRQLTMREQEEKKAKKQAQATEHTLQHRARKAKKEKDNTPKILAGLKANSAQNSAASLRATHAKKVSEAQKDVGQAQEKVTERDPIVLPQPQISVPEGRRLGEIELGHHRHIIQGAEKIALTGPNGSGKTTLLNDLVSGRTGTLNTSAVQYLTQNAPELETTPVQLLENNHPELELSEIRYHLSKLGLAGDQHLLPYAIYLEGNRPLYA